MREDGHHAEEECLFFVGLSRAQDYLSLSRADQYMTRKASESRFLASIGSGVPIIQFQGTGKNYGALSALQPPGAREAYPERDLDLYMQYPARYSYIVVDGLRGSRAESAYLRFHRAVYITIRWLEDERQNGRTIDEAGALSGLAEVWQTDGPIDHPFEKYYSATAESMVVQMAGVITSETGRYEREEWSVPVGQRNVLITPDRVFIGSNGTVRVQRIRTGRQTKSEPGKPIYALMRRGAQRKYPDKHISVEIFYLATNESVEVVAKNDDKLIAEYADAIRSIEAGDFHAEMMRAGARTARAISPAPARTSTSAFSPIASLSL